MAKKSFSRFLMELSSSLDIQEHLLREDPKIARIYNGNGDYQERMSSALWYWRGRHRE